MNSLWHACTLEEISFTPMQSEKNQTAGDEVGPVKANKRLASAEPLENVGGKEVGQTFDQRQYSNGHVWIRTEKKTNSVVHEKKRKKKRININNTHTSCPFRRMSFHKK